MPIINQTYAFVTLVGWEQSLSKRWPDAPTYGGYKILVFAGTDLTPLEEEYSEATFKYLTMEETIVQIEAGNVGPFICNIGMAIEVARYFTPEEEI